MNEASAHSEAAVFPLFIAQVAEGVPGFGTATMEVTSRDELVDLVAWRDGLPYVIKAVQDTPRTEDRLAALSEQLTDLARRWRKAHQVDERIGLILAVPGPLPRESHRQLNNRGVLVWDGPTLKQAAAAAGFAPPPGVALRAPLRLEKPESMVLGRRLRRIPIGRGAWPQYQSWCSDVLRYLFSPPLEPPLWESSNASRVNRRDLVLPNYADEGPWAFLRQHYAADLVIVDAKNTSEVSKAHVLQLANYLSHHGAGLFGLILTRRQANRGAVLTLREQWVLHDKMIIVLTDSDVYMMLASKEVGDDPAVVLRQRIEDFRLGV